MSSSNPLLRFYGSSIGKKVIMAITGLMIIGFIVMHLLGNLQIFLGSDKFNDYAAFLKSIPGPLWVARIILIATFILHFGTAFVLRGKNKIARGGSYKDLKTVQADFASLYMVETGIVILLFVGLHLLHFTLGRVQPEFSNYYDYKGNHDVYKMVIAGFSNGPFSYIYIVAMLAIGVHLKHAFWSMFQTIGVYSPTLTPLLKKVSIVFAGLITLGYVSIPLSVILGILN